MRNAELFLRELPENIPVRVERGESPVLVIRSGERVFAYEDKCPHAFWPLSQGTVIGKVLECPGHGWEFNIENGNCVNSPAYCLRPVALRVEGGRILWEKEEENISTGVQGAYEADSRGPSPL